MFSCIVAAASAQNTQEQNFTQSYKLHEYEQNEEDIMQSRRLGRGKHKNFKECSDYMSLPWSPGNNRMMSRCRQNRFVKLPYMVNVDGVERKVIKCIWKRGPKGGCLPKYEDEVTYTVPKCKDHTKKNICITRRDMHKCSECTWNDKTKTCIVDQKSRFKVCKSKNNRCIYKRKFKALCPLD